MCDLVVLTTLTAMAFFFGMMVPTLDPIERTEDEA